MSHTLQDNLNPKTAYQLKAVLNALPYAIVFIDKNFSISNFNTAFAGGFESFLGITPSVGMELFGKLTSPRLDIYKQVLRRAFQGITFEDRTHLSLLNTSLLVSYKIQPIYDDQDEIIEISIALSRVDPEASSHQAEKPTIEKLLNTQENLCLLFDNFEDAIWSVDASYALIAFNLKFKQIYLQLNGIEVAIGRKMLQDKDENSSRFWRSIYRKALQGENLSTIYTAQQGDDCFYFELKSSPIMDVKGKIQGATFIARDISRQIQDEEKIKQNLAYQQAILNSGKKAVWAVDKDLNLLFYNNIVYKIIKKMTGQSMQINTPIQNYFVSPDNETEEIEKIYHQTLKGETVNCQKKVSWNNHFKWIEFDLSPIQINSQIVGALVNAKDITKKKQFEALLCDVYKIAKMGDWVLDLEKNEITWSRNFYELLGFQGKNLKTDLDSFKKVLHPDSQSELEQLLDKGVFDAKEFILYLRVLQPTNPKEIHLRCVAKIHKNTQGKVYKIVGVIQDVTESKIAELEIKSQKEFLESLIENLPIGIFAKEITEDFKYSIWNRKMEEIFELDRKQVIGKTDFEIEKEYQIAQSYRETDEQVVQENTLLHIPEQIIKKTSGNLITNIIKLIIPDPFGKPHYLLGMVEDITAHKRTENALKKAKENAEKATRSKSEFLSTVSHEIRTPLNAVIGLSNLLLDESPLPDQVEKMEALKFSAENLLALINDILDYNKIEAGKIEFEEIDFDLKEVCSNLRRSLELQAKEKGLKLKVIYDEDIPQYLAGDTLRLSQVLYNLLSNALKFTHQGSVKLILELVRETDDQAEISFSVVDTGIGIPLEKQEMIFEQFTQSGPEITRKYGGTGLGLAITKRLLELQNSRINLKSAPGEGSNFYFNLYFKKSKNKSPDAIPHKYQAYRSDQLKGLPVLVAEDNAINRFVIKNYLEKWGIHADFAENGHTTLELLARNNYALILMDLEMPELDGIQTTQIIRQNPETNYHQIPIIALTASVTSQVGKEVIQAGMNDYISKPFSPSILYHKLLKLVPNFNPENYPPPIELASEELTDENLINLEPLNKYNSSDDDFKEKFLLLLRDEIQKFAQGYQESMLKNNPNQLSIISHKLAPNLKLIHFQKLISEIEKGKKLLKNKNNNPQQIHDSIKAVERLSADFSQFVEDFLS